MGAKDNEHGSERNYCCCQKVECLSPNLASICWDSHPRANLPNAKKTCGEAQRAINGPRSCLLPAAGARLILQWQ